MTKLCAQYGYGLTAISSGGLNAIYVVRALMGWPPLAPAIAYRENQLRNAWSGTRAVEQWEVVKSLPLVRV